MTVLATLKDGRIIAKATFTTMRPTAAGNVSLTATVSDCRVVEEILKWTITATPIQTIDHPRNEAITGNIVGGTVYAGAGCTVSGSSIVLGF